MVQSHRMLQCSGVKCSLKVQWILGKIILTWNVWWLLIVDDILEIQSWYYSTLEMVNSGWWWSKNPNFKRETPERQLPHKKEEDCEYPRWSILEMLKSIVIMFQQARFQSSRLPIVHGYEWMYGRSWRRREGIIASDLVVVLFCSSNLFLSIQLKWGMGVGGGVWLSSLYWVGVCIMYVVQCKKKYVLKN